MSSVWVVGEVLIDIITNGTQCSAVVGGGPANTAIALSRLGVRTQFIDGISKDKYGKLAKKELEDSGVRIDYINYSDKPTCLAKVTLTKSGVASYNFIIENTATFDFTLDWLPNPKSNPPSLLYIGTLAAVIEPGSSTLFNWARNVAKFAPIVFDPNVRPSVINNRQKYVNQVERWIEVSAVIKVSDEDLRWLYPEREIDELINSWLSQGPELVVVTFGSKGLVGYRSGERVRVQAVKVKVADTIGAGDTVGAILLETLTKESVHVLTGKKLESLLKRAAKAAAITVSRLGANPPFQNEI